MPGKVDRYALGIRVYMGVADSGIYYALWGGRREWQMPQWPHYVLGPLVFNGPFL